MQKITPFIWFDKEAREAAEFYTSLFPDSKLLTPENYDETPSGSVEVIPLQLMNQDFTFMSAGPHFKPNPCISFLVYCQTESEIDAYWKQLSDEGMALMPLDTWPFAKKYGWVQDKYGLSWQLMLTDTSEKQKVSPLLMFSGDQVGKTLDAIDLYTNVFKDSQKIIALHYHEGEGDKPEYIKHAEFLLEGQMFMAMDSSLEHKFSFNEAISFVIDCNDQTEVDYFWEKFTANGGEESMCGWLKDKFGVSWQVVPRRLTELLTDPNPDKAGKAMQAMLQMKKIIIKDLEIAVNNS